MDQKYFDFNTITDCTYYYKGTCNRGGKCVFRHKFNNSKFVPICNKWNVYKCFDKECKYMHPAGPIELCKSASIVPSKVLAVNNEKLDNAQYDIKFEEVVSIQSIENKQNINCKYHMHGKCQVSGIRTPERRGFS